MRDVQRSLTDLTSHLRRCWHAPDQYERLVHYLSERGLFIFMRLLLGATLIGMALITTSTAFSTAGPTTQSGRILTCGVIVGCVALAMNWWLRTPGRLSSYVLIVSSDVAIAAAAIGVTSNHVRAFTCVIFASVGAYIALLHTLRIQLVHLVWSVAVTLAVIVPHFDSSADPLGTKLSRLGITLATIVAGPLLYQLLLPTMTVDAADSERDPLTSLLNRRGFEHRAQHVIKQPIGDDQALVVVVVDLDNLKTINDTFGHDAGDRMISRVATRIAQWSARGSVVARTGGDEFVILQRIPAAGIGRLASEAAQLLGPSDGEPSATTSVGIAARTTPWDDDEVRGATLDALVRSADAALYEAKRAGGNRGVCVRV